MDIFDIMPRAILGHRWPLWSMHRCSHLVPGHLGALSTTFIISEDKRSGLSSLRNFAVYYRWGGCK